LTNLAPYHSFALPYQAMGYQTFNSVQALQQAAQTQALFDRPHLILGEGSNTIFSCDYDGTIIRLLNHELSVTEDQHFTYLSVDGGYPWHQLVGWALDNGIYGLENLALIPGTVGAAPIQNIGAYGVQFEDFCQYVEYLDKNTLEIVRLNKSELQFAYRNSLFKGGLKDQTVITKVGLKLPKAWRPVLSYGGLDVLAQNCQPRQLFDKVIEIRRSKLPDPAQIPNAGSFFKNPLVSQSLVTSLSSTYPKLPKFQVDEHHQKIPAAWLIEQCGLKGAAIGGISIYQQHALIITNQHQGTGGQLLELIELVRAKVYQQFGIELEPEVRVMGKCQPYSFCAIKA
jgi:UDP-N-acetylmuramate dehydrogenase